MDSDKSVAYLDAHGGNGKIRISDCKQLPGLYPGPAYRTLKPAFKVYRASRVTATTALAPRSATQYA